MKHRVTFVIGFVLIVGSLAYAASIPKEVKPRFVTGEPIWRELPVRPAIQQNYDQVWQTAVNTILEHNFDIATMDKSSGYARTTWNERFLRLSGNWTYRIQISVKLVTDANQASSAPVSKVRLQVAGEVLQTDNKGNFKQQFRGYDQLLLQELFQDLQSKLGGV